MSLPDPQPPTDSAVALSAGKSLAANSVRLRFAIASQNRYAILFDASTKFLREGNRNLKGQSTEEVVAAVNTMSGDVSLREQTHAGNTHVPFGKNLAEKIAPCHFRCAAQRHQTRTEKPVGRRFNQEIISKNSYEAKQRLSTPMTCELFWAVIV